MARDWQQYLSLVILVVIVTAYLALGTLYAVYTPPWQVPDEPAHYNYVRHIAETGTFPVLRRGDYSHQYLEAIKARRFPPDMPITPIRYEFHQPPLYYLLATPVYLLFGGRLLPLRLFSVLLGGGLLLVAYALVREIFPRRWWPALGTTAFIAFIPQHIAMTAAVNNDALAELILAGIGLVLVKGWRLGIGNWELGIGGLRGKSTGSTRDVPSFSLSPQHLGDGAELLRYPIGNGERRRGEVWWAVGLGVLMGLGLLTKTTVYISIPLALAVFLWRGRLQIANCKLPGARSKGQVASRNLIVSLLLAVLIAAPWWGRNVRTYGDMDVLGLKRHDAVVVGQLRTADWLAGQSIGTALRAFVLTTFHSFWGQFGWMAVPMPGRIYQGLGLLCGVAGMGFLFWLVGGWRREVIAPDRSATGQPNGSQTRRERNRPPADATWQRAALGLLALWAFLTGLSYLWYNTKFVQHQGRYLFPALVPIGLAFTLGLREVLRWVGETTMLLLARGRGGKAGRREEWKAGRMEGGKTGKALQSSNLPTFQFLQWVLFALPYLALAALASVCPFWFIRPYL